MQRFIKALLALIMILVATTVNAEDARAIMQKVIDQDDGETQYAQQVIATCQYVVKNNRIACAERPRIKELESVRKDYGETGNDKKSVMIILRPQAEKGIGFLQYDYDELGKDTDQWMYLSALGKVKRIVSGSEDEPKTGTLFGSEFSYEDVEQRRLDDYSYKIVKEETYQGEDCWVIEALPKPEHARKSNYSRALQWVDKKRYLPLKAEMYDRRGRLVKQMTLSDYEKVSGVWVAKKLNMNNIQTRRISTMKLDFVSINISVHDDFLTQRTLTDGAFRENYLSTIRSVAE